MKNWITTITGICTLILSAIHVINTGNVTPETIATVTAGVGLIGAKDFNVTGGTKQQ